jgi:hypothetical protein
VFEHAIKTKERAIRKNRDMPERYKWAIIRKQLNDSYTTIRTENEMLLTQVNTMKEIDEIDSIKLPPGRVYDSTDLSHILDDD